MELVYEAEREGFVTWTWFEDTKTLLITFDDFTNLSDDEFDAMMMKNIIVDDILNFLRKYSAKRSYGTTGLYYFDGFTVQLSI